MGRPLIRRQVLTGVDAIPVDTTPADGGPEKIGKVTGMNERRLKVKCAPPCRVQKIPYG